MPEIINGLQIDVKSDEMKKMLSDRVAYHESRIAFYEKQQEVMSKVDAAMAEESAAISKTSNRSPSETIGDALKKHRDQLIYYKFMHEHVIEDSVYRLSENDLVRLGVKSDRHY
jgi:hypothetical protein